MFLSCSGSVSNTKQLLVAEPLAEKGPVCSCPLQQKSYQTWPASPAVLHKLLPPRTAQTAESLVIHAMLKTSKVVVSRKGSRIFFKTFTRK